MQQSEIVIGSRTEMRTAVRDLRAARGLSQAQLAHRAGVAQVDMDRIERGDRSAVALLDVAGALGYEIVLRPAARQSPPPTGVRGRSRAERDRDGRLSERLAMKFPEPLDEALKRYAASCGRSTAQILREALIEWLALADPRHESYFWPGTHERGTLAVPYGGLRLTEELDAALHTHAAAAGVAAGEVVRLAARNMLLKAGESLHEVGCHIESDAPTALMLRRRREALAADRDTLLRDAADASTAPERLDAISKAADDELLMAVVTNPSTPESSVVRVALEAARGWYRGRHRNDHGYEPTPLMQEMAEWDGTPAEALDYLYSCERLHLWLAWHPNSSQHLLDGLRRVSGDTWEGEANGTATERLDEMDIDWQHLARTECDWWAKLDAVWRD